MPLMDGITYTENFLPDPDGIFGYLKENIDWDTSMAARKTASYGVAYNYSQMSYPFRRMPQLLKQICMDVLAAIGFEPNNCLANYYLDGKSKMGFHSDQTDILEENTGVAIISLGQARILRFRNIIEKDHTVDFELHPGSLLYMDQSVQKYWEHAISKSDIDNGRISLTLRKIKPSF
jgi:alkylated DNA repair dioxygenase AlkB